MTKKKKKSSRKLMASRYRRRSAQDPFQTWVDDQGKMQLIANRAGRRKMSSERRKSGSL